MKNHPQTPPWLEIPAVCPALPPPPWNCVQISIQSSSYCLYFFSAWNWTAVKRQCFPNGPFVIDLFQKKNQEIFFFCLFIQYLLQMVLNLAGLSAVVVNLGTVIPPVPALTNILVGKTKFLPLCANQRMHVTCFLWLVTELLLYLRSKFSG